MHWRCTIWRAQTIQFSSVHNSCGLLRYVTSPRNAPAMAQRKWDGPHAVLLKTHDVELLVQVLSQIWTDIRISRLQYSDGSCKVPSKYIQYIHAYLTFQFCVVLCYQYKEVVCLESMKIPTVLVKYTFLSWKSNTKLRAHLKIYGSYNREIMAIIRIKTTVWATSHRAPSNVQTKSIVINLNHWRTS
jgi:hypothetical protein